MFFSFTALLIVLAALLLSCLVYFRQIRKCPVSVANLCWALVAVFSLAYAAASLREMSNWPGQLAVLLEIAVYGSLYAGVLNVAARIWERFAMGNKSNVAS